MNFKKRVNGSWTDTPHYLHTTSTDTITTLPADLYADGTNATVGLKGNMAQSGTPSPTTPIQPQECGERTGNLINVQPFTIEGDSSSHNILLWSGTLPIGTYTISLNQDDNFTSALRNTIRLIIGGTTYYESATENYHLQSGQHKMTFTISDSSQSVEIRYWGNTLSNDSTFSNIMLNTGSTALPYEPYGYKIPISSANTTTPVYLGEVESTRQIKKYIFDGTEQWQRTANGAYYLPSASNPISNYKYISADISINSHFPSQGMVTASSFVNDGKSAFFYISANTTREYYIAARDIPTLENFKTYLAQQYSAGTPVTVWYVLATPQTAVVNEPIRKIGEYADTVSGITVPTIAGADTFSVGTTLQPSEVTVNYHGWHPVADVHERESGAWT